MKNNTFSNPIVLMLIVAAIAVLALAFVAVTAQALITFGQKALGLIKDNYSSRDCNLESLYNNSKTKLTKTWNWIIQYFQWVYRSIFGALFQNDQAQQRTYTNLGTLMSSGRSKASKIVDDVIINVTTIIGNITVGSSLESVTDYMFSDGISDRDRVTTLAELNTPSERAVPVNLLNKKASTQFSQTPIKIHENDFKALYKLIASANQDKTMKLLPGTNFFVSEEEFTVIQPQLIDVQSESLVKVVEKEHTVLKPQDDELELPKLPANWKKLPDYKLKLICTAINKICPKSIKGHTRKKVTKKYLIEQILQAYK